MIIIRYSFLLFFIFSIYTNGLSAREGWVFSTFLGFSESANTTIKFKLNDQPKLSMTGKYEGKSWTDSHYWFGRFERWSGKKGLGIELIHHKIYLKNTTDIIENFSISDGYNLLHVNIAREKDYGIWRLGVGAVIAHPDATFQGREQYKIKGSKGLHWAGPSAAISFERVLYEKKQTIVSLEGKINISYAKVPISDHSSEYAEVPNIGFHIALGFCRHLPKQSTVKQKVLYLTPYLYSKVIGGALGT